MFNFVMGALENKYNQLPKYSSLSKFAFFITLFIAIFGLAVLIHYLDGHTIDSMMNKKVNA